MITYYDGQIVEADFQSLIEDRETRYELFKCRLAGAGAIKAFASLIVGVLVGLYFMQRHR